MSLVAYDNSDSSEYEDDNNESSPVILCQSVDVTVSSKPSKLSENSVFQNEHENEADRSLFNALPHPTNRVSRVIEEEDEFLHKKATNTVVKPKSKITVPSLSDFKDVIDTVPNAKPRAVNGKKSGLLSMLPQPRNGSVSIKSLIPHVLKQSHSNITKKVPFSTAVKKVKEDKAKVVKDYSDDSDIEEEVQNDFFSINKKIEDIPDIQIDQNDTELIKNSVKNERRSIESYFKKDVENSVQEPHCFTEPNKIKLESVENLVSTTNTASDGNVLDEEAILKLVGARGKRRREEIQIIDFNQQEVLAEAKELLLKGLMDDTSKRVSASKRKGNEPTNMQKRKHQITYLAHQAKANEVELQNKWANNRLSKRQTQSKYGF